MNIRLTTTHTSSILIVISALLSNSDAYTTVLSVPGIPKAGSWVKEVLKLMAMTTLWKTKTIMETGIGEGSDSSPTHSC